MVEMTREERKVANFLTEKRFKWEFQPSVSVKDDGDRTRLFNPDFLLTDLGIYIEVCGAERTEHYERTREIYKKNKVPIIYVETYKVEDKWQFYLIQSIKEIHEKRQSAVSTIIPQQPVVDTPLVEEVFKNKYFNFNLSVSEQAQIGVLITILGIVLIFGALIIAFFNMIISFILLIIGLIVFYIGFRIVSFRFVRWFRNWYRTNTKKFQKWLEKY